MLTIFRVISDYDVDNTLAVRAQSKKAQKSILRLLYAIPTCEDLFISACFRQLSEELLKIVYAKTFNRSITSKKLSKLNYRQLWKDGIKSTSLYKKDSKVKKFLDQINNIFKEKSDNLHSKDSNLNNSTVYLQQIITEGTDLSKRDLYSTITVISSFTIDCLPILCSLDINLMTMSQRSSFLKMVKSLRY
ncbi:hypothetical protein LBSG162_17000 [Lentilactobacillus buchneri subsp. silagei]|nr:hypothetical protein LBSG162_17000 [Lentilactobacillus buchneri subsp. silagei]